MEITQENNYQKHFDSLPIESLQKYINYLALKNYFQILVIGNVFWGGIALYFAYTDRNSSALYIIGSLLVFAGIYFLIQPKRFGILINSFLLLIIGFWNISIVFQSNSSDISLVLYMVSILGLFQIIWSTQTFSRYRYFSGRPLKKPSLELSNSIVKFGKRIVDNYKKGLRYKRENLSVTIIYPSFLDDQRSKEKWIMSLGSDYIIFVEKTASDLLFADRNSVSIEKIKKKKSEFKLSIEMDSLNANYMIEMDDETLTKFRKWHSSGEELPI